MKLLVSVFLLLALTAYCYSEERFPVLVLYTVWIGDEKPSKIHTIPLLTKRNKSLYDVMEQASYLDPRFKFETQSFGDKHYVTSIGGVAEDKETDHYWMVYKLKSYPNPLKPPTDDQLSPVGVDDIFVSNFDNYLLWYRHVDLGEHKK